MIMKIVKYESQVIGYSYDSGFDEIPNTLNGSPVIESAESSLFFMSSSEQFYGRQVP